MSKGKGIKRLRIKAGEGFSAAEVRYSNGELYWQDGTSQMLDEQFNDNFDDVVKQARAEAKATGLVFKVDEVPSATPWGEPVTKKEGVRS